MLDFMREREQSVRYAVFHRQNLCSGNGDHHIRLDSASFNAAGFGTEIADFVLSDATANNTLDGDFQSIKGRRRAAHSSRHWPGSVADVVGYATRATGGGAGAVDRDPPSASQASVFVASDEAFFVSFFAESEVDTEMREVLLHKGTISDFCPRP